MVSGKMVVRGHPLVLAVEVGMALFLRTIRHDMTSWKGFQWPTLVGATVEAPDWSDGGGLHGLKDGRGNLSHLDLFGIACQDRHFVIFEGDDGVPASLGAWRVPVATVRYIGDLIGALHYLADVEGLTVREWVCKTPNWAYYFALLVDRAPHDDTRQASCMDPDFAVRYAAKVDTVARDDTRQAACRNPFCALDYAIFEGMPHEMTRIAACQHPKSALRYAWLVDGCQHPDTLNAVKVDPYWSSEYARFVTLGSAYREEAPFGG